ncbi:hypothetical protein KR222_011455, partial [Zaprionus bogoriensis]
LMQRIMHGEIVPKPVLLLVAMSRINSDLNRYRLLVSDGKFFNSYVMLASRQQLGLISDNSIVRLDQYATTPAGNNGERVLIIHDLTVLSPGEQLATIGNPICFKSAAGESSFPAKTQAATSEAEVGPLTVAASSSRHNRNDTKREIVPNLCTIYSIASLRPVQNTWNNWIKARVVSKKLWANGQGFNICLKDASGEIRATVFSAQFSQFHDLIEIDTVYYFCKFKLQAASKRYYQAKHDYEINFQVYTEVKPSLDDDSIPRVSLNLVLISKLKHLQKDATVDAIGICKNVGELKPINNSKLRELTLDDSSGVVTLTIWGNAAINWSMDQGVSPVVLVRGVRINEFMGGKSLSMIGSSVLQVNPNLPEAHKLREWFDSAGGDNTSITNNVSDLMTFRDARIRNLGSGGNPNLFRCKAIVRNMKTDIRGACPRTECNKRVVVEGHGQYRCEGCSAVFTNFKYRLLIKMDIRDWTCDRWVTCHNDVAEQLLGQKAQQVGEALENRTTTPEELLTDLIWSCFVFKLRVSNECYDSRSRNMLTVQSLTSVDYKEYNGHLIRELQDIIGV